MPTNPDPLSFGNFYHIFNRGNNHENVFIQERNYAYFMELWWKHTSQIAETYSYCLLKNHFHITGYIKNKEDISTKLKIKEPSQYFANFLTLTRGELIMQWEEVARYLKPHSNEYLLLMKNI